LDVPVETPNDFIGHCFILGITFINKFYKFSSNEQPVEEKDFIVMSYNVRLFNLFQWIPRENVGDDIKEFINEQNPDILCIQEYSETAKVDLRVYKHKFIFMQGKILKRVKPFFLNIQLLIKEILSFQNRII